MAQAFRKIETVTAVRSPERERLAQKVERIKGWRDQLARIRKSIEENPRYEASASQARAEAALKRARETEAARTTARLIGDPEPEGLSVDEAQRAFDAATKEYDRISQIIEALKQTEADTERELGYAEMSMPALITAVVQSEPAVAALLKRYQAALREASRLRLTVQSFSRVFPHELRHWDGWDSHFRDVSADPAWSAWVAALEHDADAPAPEVA